MGVISKVKSEQLTYYLLKNNYKELDEIEKEVKKYLTSEAEKLIPRAVMAIFRTPGAANYFHVSSRLQVINKDDKFDFHLNEPLPSGKKYGAVQIYVNKDKYLLLKNIVDKFEDKRIGLDQLKTELESTLYALRTEKKILDQFPELSSFFTKKANLLPSNIESIKSKII